MARPSLPQVALCGSAPVFERAAGPAAALMGEQASARSWAGPGRRPTGACRLVAVRCPLRGDCRRTRDCMAGERRRELDLLARMRREIDGRRSKSADPRASRYGDPHGGDRPAARRAARDRGGHEGPFTTSMTPGSSTPAIPREFHGRHFGRTFYAGAVTAARRASNSSRGGPGGEGGRDASHPRIVSIRSCSASSSSKTAVRSSRPMRRMVRRRTRSS
jgi:hypothetical protein